MRYVFHPEALSEYAEAVQYYAERRVELAQAFIDTVEEVINRIKDSPTRWQIIDEDVRRCLTRKFPYEILYTLEQDYILILAIAVLNHSLVIFDSRLPTPDSRLPVPISVFTNQLGLLYHAL